MVSRPVPGGGCRMVPEWFRSGSGADAGEIFVDRAYMDDLSLVNC